MSSRGSRTFPEREALEKACARLHMLGTSGTVTTLAGVHMDFRAMTADRWTAPG